MESIERIISLRREGLREKAIRHLEEYLLSNPGDLDMVTTLKVWKKEVKRESWRMARRDSHRSSWDKGYGSWSHVREVWNYRFHSPLTKEFLPDIPSPIIALDMLFIPDPSLKSFIGLEVSCGKPFTSNSILGVRLSYASTPVYIIPFLFFAVNGAIYEISLSKDELSIKPVLTDIRIQLLDYVTPICLEDEILFVFKEWILIYKPDTSHHRFIPVKLSKSDDFLRAPVVLEDMAIFLSRFGERLNLPIKGDSLYRVAGPLSGTLCSPPCLVGNRIYFEFLNKRGLRGIYTYDPKGDGRLTMGSLEEGVCSPNDTHLNFSPLVFQEGTLVSSDIGPRFYYTLEGYPMRVVPIEIEIQTGRLRIHQASHIFSFILGNRLVGKALGGFFHLDLLNPKDGLIEVFRPKTEIIAQPLNYGDRLFFLTQDGVRCYTIR